MRAQRHKILLVEPDADIVEILVAALTRRFDAQITCVADAKSCIDTDLAEPHDLVITELELGDSDGLRLTRDLAVLGTRPFILLADEARCEDAIEAMRSGVRDMFCKPFPVARFLDAAERLLNENEVRRRRAAKYHRMRELVRRVISERRDLKRRIELICRDLVGAQRRLVHRVLESEQAQAQGST